MSVEPGRRDAVRLLTVHGAKGLQAPVVFLADPRPDQRRAAAASGSTASANRPRATGAWPARGGSSGSVPIAQPPGWEEMCDAREGVRRRGEDAAALRRPRPARERRWSSAPGGRARAMPREPGRRSTRFPRRCCRQAPAARAQPRRRRRRGLRAALAAFRATRAARFAASSRVRRTPSRRSRRSRTPAGEKPAWESTGRGLSWGRVLHAVLESAMRDDDGRPGASRRQRPRARRSGPPRS